MPSSFKCYIQVLYNHCYAFEFWVLLCTDKTSQNNVSYIHMSPRAILLHPKFIIHEKNLHFKWCKKDFIIHEKNIYFKWCKKGEKKIDVECIDQIIHSDT